MPSVQAPAPVFRPEIEGLRAVAAILVALYHVFFGRVSGGVDVFFLVAGFLITSTLVRQAESGRLDLGRYLSRLARRLLPGALVVLSFVVVTTLIWLPESRRPAALRETGASLLYVENWALARNSTDYLARDEALSPVQHFWAMSIQGQFYLIWFVLVAVVMSRRRSRAAMTTALSVMFLGSLAFSVYLTEANQPLAYFHTGTRVWEFAAGGLLALVIDRLDARQGRLSIPLGWIGLALILSCGVLIPVSDSFPGWIAMWPIGGAVLVLATGRSTSRFAVSRLLSARPFVYLGGISYALYLWHWPILALYLSRTDGGTADLLPGLLIIAVSLALSAATTRWVERPVRDSLLGTRKPALAVLATAIVLGMLGSASYAFGREPAVRPVALVGMAGSQHPGPTAVSEGWDAEPALFDEAPAPTLAVAKRDRANVYSRGCHVGVFDSRPQFCSDGNESGKLTIMVLGGSHSAHWQPALELIAKKRGYHLISGTKAACQFSAEAISANTKARKSCENWNNAVLKEVERIRPDYVFTTSTQSWGRPHEQVPPGYVEQWAALERLGVNVLAVRDTPRSAVNQVECLEANRANAGHCRIPRAEFYAPTDPTKSLSPAPTNVQFLDLSDLFCGPQECPAIIGNVVVYFDHSHMTATWSRAIAPYLERQLPTALQS